MNRRYWLIASTVAVVVFALGFTAGTLFGGGAPRSSRALYRSLGGYELYRTVINDRTADVYTVGPKGIHYIGNMRDAARPANWPAVPAEVAR